MSAQAASSEVHRSLEQVARPLLELVHRITGMETSFLTSIDWEEQTQDVLFALNTEAVITPEGSQVPWAESMCRWAFLSGREATAAVPQDFPGSIGAQVAEMQSFMAIPVVQADDAILGTVCAASRRPVAVDSDSLQMVRLIAEALAHQLALEAELKHEQQRSRDAETQLQQVARTAQEMELLAGTDWLTGLANRRGFMARWEQELARSARQDYGISVLMLDLDNFKSVNDQSGHAAGDAVLRALADCIRKAVRTDDFPARVGGDEFSVAVTFTHGASAVAVAERIAEEFRECDPAPGLGCTVSIGISSSANHPRRLLLEEADRALYRAKSNGGNRIEFAADLPELRWPSPSPFPGPASANRD
jgi:diguanylate cyclase